MHRKQIDERATLVIGLGRFGTAIASTLDALGRDVLAIERDHEIVAQWSHRFRIIEADSTNLDALEQAGARDFGIAVVGIGTSLEASVLATGNLVDIGVPQIWAKATSRAHGRILRRIGAHHVVYPEYDAGARVAHMVSGKMLDYIEMEDGFSIIKMRPPREIQGYTLDESKVRERYGVKIIGVKSPGQPFEYSSPETKVGPEDIIIVSGESALLEEFADRS